jgi:transposase-like protein
MMSITTELIDTGAKRDGRGRRIATAEEKEAMVAQYRESGLTQKAFAQREGLKFSTFTSWVQGRRKAGRKVRFAELPTPAMAGLAVQLPDGTVIRGTSAGEVAELVRALRC